MHLPTDFLGDAFRDGFYLAPELPSFVGMDDPHQVLKGGTLAQLDEKEQISQKRQNGASPHQP